MTISRKQSWSVDQLAKSEFFHQKLHEWGLITIAQAVDQISGEHLDWDLSRLDISIKAWNKIIHRGIKPVVIFAHPAVLSHLPRSTAYYRMLSMVSQKSMGQVGLSIVRYEKGTLPSIDVAERIARHLNRIISRLVEADDTINPREFDLWRGMAAGAQAQGSWQNTKGQKIETVIRGIVRRRLQERHSVAVDDDTRRFSLLDGRMVVFADEPDIGIYRSGKIIAAVEIKGGIDKAGVLERVGAAVKSLSRVKEENSTAVTVLILQGVSITEQSNLDLQTNQNVVNHWFTVEELLEDDNRREALFGLLKL
ncbi:MAG: XcyI family restriction endonuclease [Chloroflexi bacterium]|nr:MAG: XcyI family restriction endonuclease [Chloroflexota bacterium]